MTRRERLEAKREKREQWAASARAKSEGLAAGGAAIADRIPLGQPILVGHHSERRARRDAERIQSAAARSYEAHLAAERHERRAEGIARALDVSIFDDDPDAIERLEARIAEAEAEAERATAINKAWKKGGAEAVLAMGVPAAEVLRDVRTMGLCPWMKVPRSTTPIRAAIRRDRERLAKLRKGAS